MDFNFFENVKKEKKKGSSGTNLTRLLLLAIITIGGGALLLFSAFAAFEYMDLSNQEKNLDAQLKDSVYTEGLKTADALEAKLDEISAIASEFIVSDLVAEQLDFATISLLNEVSENIPFYLSLNSISMSNGVVSLTGQAYSLVTIAQYESNLRDTKLFAEIAVNTMSHGGDFLDEDFQEDDDLPLPHYTFDMQLALNESVLSDIEAISSGSDEGQAVGEDAPEGGTAV